MKEAPHTGSRRLFIGLVTKRRKPGVESLLFQFKGKSLLSTCTNIKDPEQYNPS